MFLGLHMLEIIIEQITSRNKIWKMFAGSVKYS